MSKSEVVFCLSFAMMPCSLDASYRHFQAVLHECLRIRVCLCWVQIKLLALDNIIAAQEHTVLAMMPSVSR